MRRGVARVSETRGRLVIVGIGDDGLAGLTEPARRTIMAADYVLAPPRALALLDAVPGIKVALDPEMGVAARQAKEALAHRQPVLVTGGDPLFYGVVRYLGDRLGKDAFEVVPHVSSMQLAFARIKESWDDAYLTSLAGRPIESIPRMVPKGTLAGPYPMRPGSHAATAKTEPLRSRRSRCCD